MRISARQWAILASVKYLALGVTGLVLLLVAKLDTFGRAAAIVLAAMGLGTGSFKIARGLRLPREAFVPTVDDLPVSERAGALRRLRLIFAVAVSILAAWTAYDLYQLESGAAGYVSTFGPAALVYQWVGFWPAVCLLPALGAIGVWIISRRLRAEGVS